MTEYAILEYMIDYFEIYIYIWLRRNCVVFDMMLLNTDTSIEAWATTTHKTCGNYTKTHTTCMDMCDPAACRQ